MKLLEPVNVGSLELPNRIIMAPLTRCRADNPGRIPTELLAEYYRQRSGAGLIISEGVAVSKIGIGYINTPGLYSDEQAGGWKKVTSAVHGAGGRIFAQIWHVGSISHPDFHNGELPHAPSGINPQLAIRTPEGRKKSEQPKAMTEEDIRQTITDFKNAAIRAIESGFDGVEIHSSNGYLFHQFFSKSTNIRSDQYAGSIENRTRFYFEVLDAIISSIPEDRVGTRLNPMYHGRAGISLDEEALPTFEYIVKRLNNYKLAYLHLSRPFFPVESPFLIENVPAHFRQIYHGHLMVNGEYNRASGEAELIAGNADSICYGRPFIGNPDLPERIKYDYPWVEADIRTFYSQGPEGYTTYPPYKA
ncbi:alkene reductase [Bacteroidota bacterium]